MDENQAENNAVIDEVASDKSQSEGAMQSIAGQEQPQTLTKEAEKGQIEPISMPMTATEWFSAMHWTGNPFTFAILPELFVGYKHQGSRLFLALEEKHKFIFLAGPTGSGKTTMLKWIQGSLGGKFDVLYIAKPPAAAEHFVDIFNEKYRKWYHFFDGKIRNIYQIPDVLNKRLREKHLFVFFDEAHESDLEVLEWLRVLSDQVTNMSVILSGLPVFEEQLKNKLETFRRRIAAKIELLSLTKEDTESLVRKRIVHAGGSGREMDALMDYIYQKSGGFPREILRACGEIVNAAIMKGTTTLDTALIEAEKPVAEAISTNILEKMTPMQQGVIELLSKGPLSPGQIANALDLSKYKSRQHAVRSVNNIVKKLYEEGFLDRQRADKAYIYSLSGRIKTLVVKS